MSPGDRLLKQYENAVEQWHHHSFKLDEFEATLNSLDDKIVTRFKKKLCE